MTQTTIDNSPYLVKLTPLNSVLVMVDYLTGFLSAIETIDAETFQNNVTALAKSDRPKVIIAGISTDNCVVQTALDLLKASYEVYIIVDASETDSKLVEDAAIARMMQAGAVITNWGCIASELMGDWQSPEGEKIGAIYQEHSQWGGQ